MAIWNSDAQQCLDADLQNSCRFGEDLHRSAEQAYGRGFDDTACTNRTCMKSNRKKFLEEQQSAHVVHQGVVKAQNSSEFSSRKTRKQNVLNGTINNSILSVPRTLPNCPYATGNHNFGASSSSYPNSKNCLLGQCPNLHINANPTLKAYEIVPASSLSANFATLPNDLLIRIAGSFSWPNLWSASRVCHSWCQALVPLREAMRFVHWGKRFKHGRGGVTQNLEKALYSFLNGAKRGCTAAMVDAGLILWNMGRKDEGVYWYKKAAELEDPAGQCNLGLAYLEGIMPKDSNNAKDAVKLFQHAALAGYVRAQYSLALCLQQGRGVDCSIVKAARWYQRAAEGGSARAMYNLALCYRKGEGLPGDAHEARRWMKQAALAGHRKAQFEHGLTLFAENEGGLSLVFLELATRAGETAATHLRDALIQQLSPEARMHAITCADKWQAKLNPRV